MFTTDHFNGAFDDFQTELEFDEKKSMWKASALGYSAKHKYQDQAINDLNEKLFNAVTNGEIVPNMGN